MSRKLVVLLNSCLIEASKSYRGLPSLFGKTSGNGIIHAVLEFFYLQEKPGSTTATMLYGYRYNRRAQFPRLIYSMNTQHLKQLFMFQDLKGMTVWSCPLCGNLKMRFMLMQRVMAKSDNLAACKFQMEAFAYVSLSQLRASFSALWSQTFDFTSVSE